MKRGRGKKEKMEPTEQGGAMEWLVGAQKAPMIAGLTPKWGKKLPSQYC